MPLRKGIMNDQAALKDAYNGIFTIGVAMNSDQIYEKDPQQTTLITKHFNSISPENILKWDAVHPEPDVYNFEPADRFVAFGEKHAMEIIGHTLVWYNQTPAWVFQDEQGKPLNREKLLERMREHIFTVMGRYKGRIHGWDVVNEAIVDGAFRTCKWLEIIGEDYVQKAFEYARLADPAAELYYNDFNMWKPRQCEGIFGLIKNLTAHGVRIDGIGTQVHWGLDYPNHHQVETFIARLSELGIKLMVTEMDVSVLPFDERYIDKDVSALDFHTQLKLNPYVDGVPESVVKKQARKYGEFISIFLEHRDIFKRLTFWGLHDGQSWRGDSPIIGRTDYPMLFARDCRPKPALEAVLNLIEK
jgi:endo-1,4-beta-xylanase